MGRSEMAVPFVGRFCCLDKFYRKPEFEHNIDELLPRLVGRPFPFWHRLDAGPRLPVGAIASSCKSWESRVTESVSSRATASNLGSRRMLSRSPHPNNTRISARPAFPQMPVLYLTALSGTHKISTVTRASYTSAKSTKASEFPRPPRKPASGCTWRVSAAALAPPLRPTPAVNTQSTSHGRRRTRQSVMRLGHSGARPFRRLSGAQRWLV